MTKIKQPSSISFLLIFPSRSYTTEVHRGEDLGFKHRTIQLFHVDARQSKGVCPFLLKKVSQEGMLFISKVYFKYFEYMIIKCIAKLYRSDSRDYFSIEIKLYVSTSLSFLRNVL